MFNNGALDVVIGLVFIYLLYSLLGTLIQEIIATNIGLRGQLLRKAIKRMLDDDTTTSNNLSKAFYKHPLIKYLVADTSLIKKEPSYITKETFSKVVIDLLKGKQPKPGGSSTQPIQTSLDTGNPAWDTSIKIETETLTYLTSIWVDAQGDVKKFEDLLQQWFNEMMDRTTGWYKKRTQQILLIVGLIIAIAFNVDTIQIIEKLQKDPKLREQIVAQAGAFVKEHPNLDNELAQTKAQIDSTPKLSTEQKKNQKNAADANYDKTKKLRDSLFKQATTLVGSDINKVNNELAIGWDGGLWKNLHWTSILGWLLTALAISLGAPFWFDLLNKLMQLRSSIATKDDPTNAGKNIKTVG